MKFLVLVYHKFLLFYFRIINLQSTQSPMVGKKCWEMMFLTLSERNKPKLSPKDLASTPRSSASM